MPLLDHVLVEQVLALPSALKLRGSGPKPLLNAALSNVLPDVIKQRTDKQGFTFPFDKWIQEMRASMSNQTAGTHLQTERSR